MPAVCGLFSTIQNTRFTTSLEWPDIVCVMTGHGMHSTGAGERFPATLTSGSSSIAYGAIPAMSYSLASGGGCGAGRDVLSGERRGSARGCGIRIGGFGAGGNGSVGAPASRPSAEPPFSLGAPT